MAVTSSVCTGNNYPGQGQCMPDLAPGVYNSTNARIGGSFGTRSHGTTTCNLGLFPGCKAIQYLDPSKFANPANVGPAASPIYLIGNTPRTQALNLRNPGTQDLDAALHRTFNLPKEFGSLVFEVDCINVWNKVTMNGPSASWNSPTSPTFGQIGGASSNNRDFQLAGHYNF